MNISFIKLKNWRNFRIAEAKLAQRSFVIGPNASGKSNMLDVFRFLRDICKPSGGGFRKAVDERGGITKLRCLHARKDNEVKIEVHFTEHAESTETAWKYILGFKSEGKGAQRPVVTTEEVWKGKEMILARPNADDKKDGHLLTVTHLEQIMVNGRFREIADFFGGVTYLHLVPQMLKYGDKIGGTQLEDDPFGQGFLERIAKCPKKTRESRLRKINEVLKAAIPQFNELRYIQDDITGKHHLEALYEHHRPHAGWHNEQHFSDGTLRLIGILWSLMEGNSLLLMEEPELSLHQAVVEKIPLLIEKIQKKAKQRRQIIISTHSETILSDMSISAEDLLILEAGVEGTTVRSVSYEERLGLDAGLSAADVVLPQTRPQKFEQLNLWK